MELMDHLHASHTIDWMSILQSGLIEGIKISLIVLVMMILLDFLNVKLKGKFSGKVLNNKWKQYLFSGLLGVLPGCSGSYASVSLYIHGTISIGALSTTMIATSGDEAFYMLAKIPQTALILFGLLFVMGIIGGIITDLVLKKVNFKHHIDCNLQSYHPMSEGVGHYFRDHIYQHIIKKHIYRIFVWSVVAIWIIHVVLHFIDFNEMKTIYPVFMIVLAALIGVIPESGPHIFFIQLFAAGGIPFSVLLASSISQDGHGMIPLLSVCIKDTMIVKLFNFLFAILFGGLFYLIGF